MPRTEQELLEHVYERSARITRRRRSSIAWIAAISTVVAVVVPYALLRDSDPSHVIVAPVASGRPTPAASPPAERDDPAAETAGDPDDQPSDPSAQDSDDAVIAEPKCLEVVSDATGDTKDRRLDIAATIIHTPTAGELVFATTLRDLTGVYSSGERLQWDVSFAFGGRRYSVRATHESQPLGAAETFRIVRETTIKEGGEVTIAALSGAIDDDLDTISVEMSVDAFNQGEAALSRREGRDAPTMQKGSVLADFETRTSTTKLMTDDADVGTGTCDYSLAG